ncbi:hypothetical protein KIW84_065482 [Lathyrus oleraceus]|uniref:Uncharacterized protein n=1 Tax=Pisum sativum TaxID=3888 RepID=A0A9D5A7H7_PEA|nr:hypothetical protein KIW84_065482 [Pisum sativum]
MNLKNAIEASQACFWRTKNEELHCRVVDEARRRRRIFQSLRLVCSNSLPMSELVSVLILRNDDDAYDFHAYACITEVDGDIYLEHDVNDIELKVRVPRCINGMTNMEGLDDDGVEDFDDSEDERTIAIIDGFYGMDVNLPITQEAICAG